MPTAADFSTSELKRELTVVRIMAMQLKSRHPVVARGHFRFVGRAGIALAVAISIPLILWQVHTWKIHLRERQYQTALDRLSQLRLDRQRILLDLTRNKRSTAAIEARIEEAKVYIAPQAQSAFGLASNQAGEVVADYFELSLAEDELNLENARQRRARLIVEQSSIEQKIGLQEALLKQ